nr:MAG TPA: hypothetical protein [Caudoviricetes sp.]
MDIRTCQGDEQALPIQSTKFYILHLYQLTVIHRLGLAFSVLDKDVR